MTAPTLWDQPGQRTSRRYVCPACRAAVTIHVEHYRPPTCTGHDRHRQTTMEEMTR